MKRREFLRLSVAGVFALGATGATAQTRYQHLAGLEEPGRFYNGRFDGLDQQALVFFTSQQRVDLCAGGFDMLVEAAPRMVDMPIIFVMPEVVHGIATDNYERIMTLVDEHSHVSLLTSPDMGGLNTVLQGFGRDVYLPSPHNLVEVFVHPQDPYLFHPDVREPSKVYARRINVNEPILTVDDFIRRVDAAKREQLDQLANVHTAFGMNYG